MLTIIFNVSLLDNILLKCLNINFRLFNIQIQSNYNKLKLKIINIKSQRFAPLDTISRGQYNNITRNIQNLNQMNKNNNNGLIYLSVYLVLIIFITLFTGSNAYLQFTLNRNHQTNQLPSKDDCITKSSIASKQNDINYDQICYFKDIAYYIQLFYQKQIHHISIDLTSPYSWLKTQQCVVSETGNSCELIEAKDKSHKQKNKHSKRKLKGLTKHTDDEDSDQKEKTKSNDDQDDQIQQKSSKKSTSKTKSDQSSSHNKKSTSHKKSQQQNEGKLARIQGSNQLVQGYLQQNKQIQFWTKDSGRLSRLFDILMLGFYMIQEKQKVALHKTNFINTTKLSQNMDQLCDGALSLRFDENSENSFLQEIFQYVQTIQKIITIYINGKESTLTIGELSVKNSALGYSGIVWVPFDQSQQKTSYGNLPLVNSIMLESLANDKEQNIQQDQDKSIFAVFSLSASYIGLPEKAINQLIKQFRIKYKLDCEISPHSYLQCTQSSSHSSQKFASQNLLIIMKEGSISLPLQSIILKKMKKKITFNLRIISKQQNQKSKSFIILGQPYFQKYFTVLDYKNNKVGFALKRTTQHNNFIDTVSLIRFVSMLFFMGCCFLLCFQPLKKMFQAVLGGTKSFYVKKSAEGRRLKYEPIQQNPYEEVAGTLRKVMEESQTQNE